MECANPSLIMDLFRKIVMWSKYQLLPQRERSILIQALFFGYGVEDGRGPSSRYI